MLQMTYERGLKIVSSERIFIVTGEKYKKLAKEQLNGIDNRNIVIEPIGRNTVPCILLASLYIKQIYNDCNIVVLLADYFIKNREIFVNKLRIANNKEYLWNAWMLIFYVDYMLKELEENFNETYSLLQNLSSIYEKEYNKVLNELYRYISKEKGINLSDSKDCIIY